MKQPTFTELSASRQMSKDGLRIHVSALRKRFQSYDGGDRPPSPPVSLIRALAEAEAELEMLDDS